MEPPPFGWRAGQGYVPPPGSQASPPPPLLAPQGYYYYLVPPPPSSAQIVCVPAAPASTVVSSAASTAVSSTVKSSGSGKTKAPPPPPKKKADKEKKDDKKGKKEDKDKKDDKTTNPNKPPALRAGMNYMYPPEHTRLHIFNKTSKVWEDKYKGQLMDFKIFTPPTIMTPAMVIENVIKKRGDEANGWAVTETFEAGDGGWVKGTTIEYGSDRAKGNLASMGWNGQRGESGGLPPVWCVVHKV